MSKAHEEGDWAVEAWGTEIALRGGQGGSGIGTELTA